MKKYNGSINDKIVVKRLVVEKLVVERLERSINGSFEDRIIVERSFSRKFDESIGDGRSCCHGITESRSFNERSIKKTGIDGRLCGNIGERDVVERLNVSINENVEDGIFGSRSIGDESFGGRCSEGISDGRFGRMLDESVGGGNIGDERFDGKLNEGISDGRFGRRFDSDSVSHCRGC